MSTKRKPRRITTTTIRRRTMRDPRDGGDYYISDPQHGAPVLVVTADEGAVWHNQEWRFGPGWGA